MSTLGGMKPTGKRIVGPGADLVEVDSAEGLRHTALVFQPEYRDHSSIAQALGPVVTFYEKPPSATFVDLIDFIPEEGAFVFATGMALSVSEIVRKLADQGRVGGVRAGLEMMYLVAQALEDAQGQYRRHKLAAHGSLNPWRILVRNNGDVQVIGFGLPQVELVAFRENESLMPKEDAFRYAPPERMEGAGEDFSADLFSLALVGFELITGRPVYDGLVSDIRQQAVRGEGQRRLYQVRDQLPEAVRELISRAIKFDRDARFPSLNEFIYAVHDLLGSQDAEGPHLLELVAKVRGTVKNKALMGGMTGALTKEQLAALRDELDDQEPKALPPPKGDRPDPNAVVEPVSEEPQRWGRAVRRGGPEAPPPAPAPRGAAPLPSRSPEAAQGAQPARQIRRVGEGGPPRAPEPPPAAPAGPSAVERPLRRSADDLPRRIRRDDGAEEGPRRIRDGGARPSLGADALLQRLRTSASGEAPRESGSEPKFEAVSRAEASRVEPPPPRATEVPLANPTAETPRFESTRAPEPPRAPEPVVAPEPPRAAEVARPQPTPRPEPPPPLVEPPPPRIDALPARAEEPQRSEVTARPEAARRDDLVYFQVSLEGGTPQRTRIRTSEPLAEACNRLVQALAAPPMDLLGSTTGWYRLEQEGRSWRGFEPVSVLEPEKVVTIAYVPNRTVLASFVVEGLTDTYRFQAPVGTAVPARSLVAHLQRWLKLPDAAWTLSVGGQPFGPMQILDEISPVDGLEILVRR